MLTILIDMYSHHLHFLLLHQLLSILLVIVWIFLTILIVNLLSISIILELGILIFVLLRTGGHGFLSILFEQ